MGSKLLKLFLRKSQGSCDGAGNEMLAEESGLSPECVLDDQSQQLLQQQLQQQQQLQELQLQEQLQQQQQQQQQQLEPQLQPQLQLQPQPHHHPEEQPDHAEEIATVLLCESLQRQLTPEELDCILDHTPLDSSVSSSLSSSESTD